MSFNYGREEKKWRLWKEAEEKELRGLGADEDTIEKLHTYDWVLFYRLIDIVFFTLFNPIFMLHKVLVLVYKCGQEKLNNLYYQMKEQRR